MIDRRFTVFCVGAALVVVVLLSGATLTSYIDERDRAACDDAGGVFHENICMDPEALINVDGFLDPDVYVTTDR